FKLAIPVQISSCFAHIMIPLGSALDAFCNVGGMGCDFGGNDTLLYILQRGQTKMLCRCHIAEERCPVGSCDGSADSSRDMIVSRRHIGHQGTQDVEGRAL